MTDTATQTRPLRDRLNWLMDNWEGLAKQLYGRAAAEESYYQAVRLAAEAAGWDQAAEQLRNELEVTEASSALRERDIALAAAYDDGFNQALRDEGH